jgi:hypothetical protein
MQKKSIMALEQLDHPKKGARKALQFETTTLLRSTSKKCIMTFIVF